MRRRWSQGESETRRTSNRGGQFLFVLYFVCTILLVMSRLGHDTLQEARAAFTDYATPVLEKASLPVTYVRRAVDRASDYADGVAEIDRLKAENERLRQWEWQAKRLERRLAQMRTLLNGVEEPALEFVTARVIADARGPFVRSVLVNAGTAQKIKLGYAVINADGLVGRTVRVGESISRVIMLNDLNSRIPVLVGPAGVRAILTGDNGPEPRLEFLSDDDNVYEDDEVYTSGHGGVFPRGLRIGTVKPATGKGFRIKPYVRLSQIEYVSVLFYDSPLSQASEISDNQSLVTKPPALHAKADRPAATEAR